MKTERNKRIHELEPWFRPTNIDERGWMGQQATILTFHSERYNSAHLFLDVPFRMPLMRTGLRVKIGENRHIERLLLPGRYVLTVSLLDRLEGTKIEFDTFHEQASSSETGSGSVRLKKIFLSTGHLHKSLSIRRRIPSDFLLRYRANKAGRLITAIRAFANDSIQIDSSNNVIRGSLIDVDPEMSKQRNCDLRYTTQPIRKLRNTARGCCFLVASGPSINEVDFNLLRDHALIGVNGSAALQQRFPIKFSYYVVTDSSFASTKFPLVTEMIESAVPCFFSKDVLTLTCALRPDLLGRGNIYVIEPTTLSEQALEGDNDFILGKNKTGFSKNIEKGFVDSGSVAIAALQVCYYLGYDRVYALGVDLTAAPDKLRFYQDEDDVKFAKLHAANLERESKTSILPAFQAISKLHQDPSERFRVFNLSARSLIPTEHIPKLSLADSLRMETT